MRIVLLASVATVAIRAFSNEIAETVAIQTPNGPVLVNKDDFENGNLADYPDAKLHKKATKENDNADDPDTTALSNVQAQPADGVMVPPVYSAVDKGDGQPANPNPSPALFVAKGEGAEKDRIFVVDIGGNRVAPAGIDPTGYASDALAWAAINALPH